MERMIIAGVDRSARSRAAADWATREALLRRLPLRVLHVVPPDAPDPVHRWPYRGEAVADHVVAELVDRHPALTVRGRSWPGHRVRSCAPRATAHSCLWSACAARAGTPE